MSQLSAEEIHVIGLTAPMLIKMLRTREERILKRIYGEFQNGKQDHLISLAEWCSVRSQIHEIELILNADIKQQEKVHADTDRNTDANS